MPKPLVALVGRPNVGKSTLFNRIVGERRAIVFDEPGTTRDRTYGESDWNGVEFDLIDTGGLQSEAAIAASDIGAIVRGTRVQAQLAIEEADAIVIVVDGRDGLLPADLEVADQLRRSNKPLIVAVNKAENQERREAAVEFYNLGLGEPIPVSAYHGTGVGDLLDAIVAVLAPGEPDADDGAPRIAIVGRPNVGKSALLNALLGQERSIVSDVPGTTRDPVDTRVLWNDQPVVLIDTAGIRRRGRVEHAAVEQYSVIRSMKAISRADVAILVFDAVEGLTAQDLHIAGFINEEAKGIIVALNKWDAVEKDSFTMETYRDKVAEELDFMPFAPVVFISALYGQRVAKLPDLVFEVIAERNRRVPTARLNRTIREALVAHPAPGRHGKALKFYYATQPRVAPPTFVFFVNDPKVIHFTYRRFLENQLRAEFGFTGTPIRLSFRGKGDELS